MSLFWRDLLHQEFLRYALLTGLLASVACGVVGTYVVVRRITYIAGGIAHCVLGGIGLARWLQAVHGWHGFDPLYGALLAALLAALIIGLVSLYAREREDTVIGALWALGMALGILFISRTPGYNQGLVSYLFGDILMVAPRDLWLIAALDATVLAVCWLFYPQFFAVAFDEEFARVRGLRTAPYYLLLLGLTALTVVLLISVVGIVLVLALLTLPVAVAGFFARRLWQMMLLAVGLSALCTTCGIAFSYGPDLPSGAVTIVLAGATYLVAVGLQALLRRRRRGAA